MLIYSMLVSAFLGLVIKMKLIIKKIMLIVMLFTVMIVAQEGDLPPSSDDIIEGEVLTQEQLNALNSTDLDLGCVVQGIDGNYEEFINGEWYWIRDTACLEIQKSGDGIYTVVEKNIKPFFKIRDYQKCITDVEIDTENGETIDDAIAYCNTIYADDLAQQQATEEALILENFRDFQVESDYNMDNFDDDFDEIFDDPIGGGD